ncbi:SPOR domain-containing protein [Zymobacter palmae]|uniref:Cell division protein n=1 Tax=Zymobacter palmae TaxID=33074 RepID=A0A348HD47_9GAMM|nr:SPOR domain-containing protein [Zymobacter palmae]BBG29549.1 cell division protein [Zymobacter palmae]
MARGASHTPSRKKTTQRSASTGSSGLPGWAKGALFVAVGFGIAYFVFGKKESSAPTPPTPPLVSPVQPPAAGNVGKPAATAQRPTTSASQAPQEQKKNEAQSFDFYTILPSSEITPTSSAPMPRATQAPAATAAPSRPAIATTATPARPSEAQPAVVARPAPAAPTTSAPTAASTSGASYILQSLSTSSQEGANTVAARLRDLGLPTQVRAVQLANGKTTYRVQSGPFPEGAERDRALGLIRVQHLDPMVIRVR